MSARIAIVGILLVSGSLVAQTRYNDRIQAGSSTLAEVEQALGKPLVALSNTRYEYPPPAGATKLTIEYLGPKVSWIMVELAQPHGRIALVKPMRLPEPPQKSGLVSDTWEELYGPPALVALSYAGTDPSSGVKCVKYYSPAMYETSMAAQWVPAPSR